MLFQTRFGFGAGGGSPCAERSSLLGFDLTSERAMAMAVAVAFVLMRSGSSGSRRSRYGPHPAGGPGQRGCLRDARLQHPRGAGRVSSP
jgi:hypothetical protein